MYNFNWTQKMQLIKLSFVTERWVGACGKRVLLWRPPLARWRAVWWAPTRGKGSTATEEFLTADLPLAASGSRGQSLSRVGQEPSTVNKKWRRVFSPTCSSQTNDIWTLAQKIVSISASSPRQHPSRNVFIIACSNSVALGQGKSVRQTDCWLPRMRKWNYCRSDISFHKLSEIVENSGGRLPPRRCFSGWKLWSCTLWTPGGSWHGNWSIDVMLCYF